MRRAVDLSLAGFLPLSVQDGLRRVLAGSRPKSPKPAFLGPSWAAAVAASANAKPIEARSVRALNLKLIRRTDPGCFRKAVLGGWGIDERDPTADRDLVEFCLTLPTDALLKDGVERPLLKTALQDRLPPELLGQGLRGYQMADWYEQIPQDDVRKFASAIRANPATASLLDWEEVDAAIENWPETGWELRPIIYRFRMRLLRALSAAEFLGSRPGRQAPAIARAGS
jgi:asparagine synthase (glutamine-hydrolysing)